MLLVSAFILTACAPGAPVATPPVQYPPQPAFSTSASAVPPDEVATETTTKASMSASYKAKGAPFDTSDLLNASQGGYGTMKNLHWFTAQAAQMSSMGLREVRIDHVFDDPFYKVVTVDASGNPVYDFSRLDQVLLPLLAHDITPLISLSYMPTALAKTAYSPPQSLDAWSALVVAFVTHYRDLGHTGWEYEVWNELDTGHWLGDSNDYNALYLASAMAVKSVDSTSRIGGPAASDLNSPGEWSRNFLNYLIANPTVPIDFFSVHSYRATGWDSVAQARQWLTDAGRGTLPIYVTEWNNDSFMDKGAGQGSDTNSSINGSSYIARRLFLASQSDADKFFYFSPVEGLNFHLPYNGDLGLVTVDGHRKSVGNVFEMYSELESTMLPTTVSGDGTASQDVYGLVTKDASKKSATAMLWNNTATDAQISLTLSHLPFAKTNFTSTVSMVSAARGNGFADASTTVAPSYPSPNENAPIIEDTVLAPAKKFKSTVLVPANGVVTIALAPTGLEKPGEKPISAEPAATNLAAAASGAVATASSSAEDASQGWSVSGINDGRRHSFEPSKISVRGWSSSGHPSAEAAESVQVDLGAVKPVDTVTLWPRNSVVSDGRGFPASFTIQGSADGATWTTLHTAAGYNAGVPVVGEQTFAFPAGEYRFLKVDATQLTDVSTTAKPSFAFHLAEFEAYRKGHINGGFESGALDGWVPTGVAEVQSKVVRGGSRAVVLTGENSGISTLITGLLPDTTYTFGIHVKSAGAVNFSVSDYGSKTESVTSDSDQWKSLWVTITTGPDHMSAELALTAESGDEPVWADDLLVTQKAE